MPSLFVFVGPISSGKSTLARQLAREGFVIVNDDAFTMAFHAGQYPLYTKSLKPLYKAVEDTAITTALTLGTNVVVDRPNLKPEIRAHYIALAHRLDISVAAVTFPNLGPVKQGKKRFASDNRGHDEAYWIEAARRHQDGGKAPSFDEGFESIMTSEACRLQFVSSSNQE